MYVSQPASIIGDEQDHLALDHHPWPDSIGQYHQQNPLIICISKSKSCIQTIIDQWSTKSIIWWSTHVIRCIFILIPSHHLLATIFFEGGLYKIFTKGPNYSKECTKALKTTFT
jgi:hypothetical protein